MQVIHTIEEMQSEAREAMRRDQSVGFVPTMGALHEGHLALIRRSTEENDQTVVSIFVNPTQFNEGQDFEAYPRTLEADIAAAEEAGATCVFAPNAQTMYSENRDTVVQVHELASNLCGVTRGRGHFIGVCTVVAKLFNIVQPGQAYFGQKDAQQALIIQRMVLDLNFPIDIIVCPIVREADGLAMSSRNARLHLEDREKALSLYRGLCRGREMIRDGERDAQTLLSAMAQTILESDVELDYLNIVSPGRLADVETIEDLVLIAGAIIVGEVRLIDNILIGPQGPFDDPEGA